MKTWFIQYLGVPLSLQPLAHFYWIVYAERFKALKTVCSFKTDTFKTLVMNLTDVDTPLDPERGALSSQTLSTTEIRLTVNKRV